MTANLSGWRWLVHFLAFGFGAGYLPRAPGTFGTLVGVLVYLFMQPLAAWLYAVIVLALFGIGVWICALTERDLGVHDHPGIVWDEIVGYLITMFLAPSGWAWIVLGFALFRLFDIWKPWPIREIERRIRGGLGNMLDDALAGICAFVVLHGVVWIVATV